MIRFECDYLEGAHPRILEKLARTNLVQTPGYGEDGFCENARRIIRRECGRDDVDVHFVMGGTQANAIMIAAALRPHQAALAPETGHIAGHETGAIEATGHKVVTLPETDGKLTADVVRQAVENHRADPAHEHLPQPGLVYVSQSTETGSVYSRWELETLSAVCRTLGLPLVLDGARLGYALAASGADLRLADLAALCDMFTIGGTKVGALFGEAVVIVNPDLKRDFRYIMKQRGGMLAKGRLLGVQFETLFEDGLYYEVSRHAIEQAVRIRDFLNESRVTFQHAPVSNQLFPVFSRRTLEALKDKYSFSPCGTTGEGGHVVRICTSWATRVEDVDALLVDLRALTLPL